MTSRRLWLLLVPVVGGTLLVRSPVADVEAVEVRGTKRLVATDVAAATGVRVGDALLLVDRGDVRRRLRELPLVDDVVVRREGWRRIVVTVTERAPALAVRTPAGRIDLYDGTGVLVESGAATAPGVPLLDSGPTAPPAPVVRAVVAVVRALPPAVRRDVTGYRATSPDEVVLRLRSGAWVIWGDASGGADKGRVLTVLLRRPGHVFDVRAPFAPAVR